MPFPEVAPVPPVACAGAASTTGAATRAAAAASAAERRAGMRKTLLFKMVEPPQRFDVADRPARGHMGGGDRDTGILTHRE
ncbi:hypothetical protein GCM10011583_38110 [Streptomyces camponoticapitis]|uniref:Uncharacterized protein n=1 Tax=Streptomyces camponoticapitis TaxID=1616125 RepID=A0ABQ2E9U5_9ACTN|nr:hypothetical protein GCM10011583_38110 [Streptomyces camponoticapitis]